MHSKVRSILLIMIMLLIPTLLPATPAAAAPAVAAPFRDYYAAHQGGRVLGPPLTALIEIDGHSAQYFEKGRIEDHRGAVADPNWAFMYGRLTAELMTGSPTRSVNTTNITYSALKAATNPSKRRAVPMELVSGTWAVHDGIFVPYDAQLRARPGYVVPLYFWSYINQKDLFPGGWLHDIGLPMTAAFLVDTVKQGHHRQIMMQAFERTVLTYDPLNPRAWQVERGNIGTDALNAPPSLTTIDLPAPNARVTMPLHLLARVGQPGEPLSVVLRWQNGVTLSRTINALRGEDGTGLLITNLDWRTESRPPQPASHAATLEIRDAVGVLRVQQPLQVLRWDDPDVQSVAVYWWLGGALQQMYRQVPRTQRIGTAALEELLWGPRPGNLAGFRTTIPSPAEVLGYPGRTASWSPRVTLRSLVIDHGLATADFSRELRAFGGDTMRAAHIRDQVTQTLLQFPSVHQVRITINGEIVPALQP